MSNGSCNCGGIFSHAPGCPKAPQFKASPLGPVIEGGDEGFDVGYSDLEQWDKPVHPEAGPRAANDTRAWRAGQTLLAYTKLAGRDDFPSSLSDMVADVQHLCDALGIDFEAVFERGGRRHDEEIHGTAF